MQISEYDSVVADVPGLRDLRGQGKQLTVGKNHSRPPLRETDDIVVVVQVRGL